MIQVDPGTCTGFTGPSFFLSVAFDLHHNNAFKAPLLGWLQTLCVFANLRPAHSPSFTPSTVRVDRWWASTNALFLASIFSLYGRSGHPYRSC
jgi:hypothetical protein